MKVTSIEILKDGQFIGYSPILDNGTKKKGVLSENGEPIVFTSRKKACSFGRDFALKIKSFDNRQTP